MPDSDKLRDKIARKCADGIRQASPLWRIELHIAAALDKYAEGLREKLAPLKELLEFHEGSEEVSDYITQKGEKRKTLPFIAVNAEDYASMLTIFRAAMQAEDGGDGE